MGSLLFGPAGIPVFMKGRKKPEDGVREVKRLELDCMELEFVYGVKMTEKGAALVRDAARDTGVRLTAHGPYYINLCSKEPEKVKASIKRVMDTARIGSLCGTESITFHAAFFQGRDEREIFKEVEERLREIISRLKRDRIKVSLRPELTGKATQFGSLEELIEISKRVKGILPCIDFAHLFARTNGGYNSYREFCQVLDELKKGLGAGILKDMHIHVSGIEYGPKGERNHLELQKSRFKWKDLLKALVDYNVEGFCICESPTREKDALLLKKTWKSLEGRK
jgi:deoxyribonuclease-4